MAGDRTALVVAIATFVIVAVVVTLTLGNVVDANTCGAGWTGYVPIGSCVKTFWPEAFVIGPVVGLLAGLCAAVLAQRATRRPEAN